MSSISNASSEEIYDGESSARGMAGAVAEKVKNTGASAAHYMRDRCQHLNEGAHHAYDAGKQTARRWEQSVESRVKSRPLTSLLVAAGIGIALGALWKRKD